MNHVRAGRAPVALRLVALVLAFLFASPGLYLLWRNVTEDTRPLSLLFSSATSGPLLRSVLLAAAVSVSAAVMGTALAWFVTRTDLPGARFWRVVMPIPLVFPTFIGAAALIRTVNPGGLLEDLGIASRIEVEGFLGAWWVLTVFTFPYVYMPVASRLRQVPRSLEESARLLGDTSTQTFRRIVVPQIAGAVLAGSLLVALYTVSDFGAVQLVRYDTLTRAIYTNRLANQTVALALSLLLLCLAGLLVLGERWLSARLTVTNRPRDNRPVTYRLGGWRLPATLLVAAAFIASVGAPLVAIGDWALTGLRRDRALTVSNEKIWDATVNTLTVSVITAVVAVAAVLPIAFLVARYRSRTGVIAHLIVIATFAIPGLLVALGIRFWVVKSAWASDTFGDSMVLLIFGYVVRFGSLAIGVVLVALQTVPPHLQDAARSLGADWKRRVRTIDLPLTRPGLLAGVGLVLLSTMKELPVSLLISPLGFSTLATRIFSSFSEALVAEAGIMAAILVALSFVLTWVLVIRRSPELG